MRGPYLRLLRQSGAIKAVRRPLLSAIDIYNVLSFVMIQFIRFLLPDRAAPGLESASACS